MPQKTWLAIRALQLDGVRLGAYAHEKRGTTHIRIDVRMLLGPAMAPASDALASVVDYVAVSEAIGRVARQRHYDLVETLATHIASDLLATFLSVVSVRLRVQKPSGLPRGIPMVIVHRTR